MRKWFFFFSFYFFRVGEMCVWQKRTWDIRCVIYQCQVFYNLTKSKEEGKKREKKRSVTNGNEIKTSVYSKRTCEKLCKFLWNSYALGNQYMCDDDDDDGDDEYEVLPFHLIVSISWKALTRSPEFNALHLYWTLCFRKLFHCKDATADAYINLVAKRVRLKFCVENA